jgi:hypothetical protein
MNKQATYTYYYQLGQRYAFSKLAEKSKNNSKVKKVTKAKSVGKASKQITKSVVSPRVTKKLTGRFATKGQKLLGKGVDALGNKLGLGLDLLEDTINASTNKGREKLKQKYRPYIKGKDSLDSVAADIINLALPTNPVSAASSGGRMLHRSLKGAKKYNKEIQEATVSGDNRRARQLIDALPKLKD